MGRYRVLALTRMEGILGHVRPVRVGVLDQDLPRTAHDEPGRFHRQLPRRDRPTGGRVLPAPLQAVRKRTPPARAPARTARRPGRRHQGRSPLTQGQPRHHRRRRNGDRKDLHRNRRRAHGRLQKGAGACSPSSGAQMEEGDRGYRSRRPCRHRHLHHRSRATALDRRRRTALRGDEPGTRKAVVPVAASHRRAMGRRPRQALP